MNLFGLNGGLTNLFGRENGGTGVSGALTPLMSDSAAGSVNGSSVGGGLNGKGSLPSGGPILMNGSWQFMDGQGAKKAGETIKALIPLTRSGNSASNMQVIYPMRAYQVSGFLGR